MKHKRYIILFLLGIVVIFSTFGIVSYTAPNPEITVPNPKISWSPQALTVTVFPGEQRQRTVKFRSSQDIQSVTVKQTPSLEPFLQLHLQQESILGIPKNIEQNLQLTLNVPPETATGTYQGTVHILDGHRTLAQPLRVAIKVTNAKQTYTNTNIGISLEYPTDWFARDHLGYSIFSNVQTFSDNPVNPAESYFGILHRANANPQHLPIQQWYEATIAPNEPTPTSEKEVIQVNGVASFRIKASLVGRYYHVYVPNGSNVIEIVYSDNTPAFNNIYANMLASVRLIP